VLRVDNGKQMVLYDNGFVVYDPISTTAIQRTLFPSRSWLKGVHLPNGKTLIFGDNVYPVIQDAYLVDPSTGYNPHSPLPLHYFHRHSAAVALNNGLVLIAGLAGTELYNPATHTSTPIQAMPTPVMAAGAVLLQDGRVFIAGGCSSYFSYNSNRSDSQLFDPTTNTWTPGPNLPGGRLSPLTLLQPNGKVLIIGGSLTQTNICEYDPATNSISTIGNTLQPFQFVRGGLLPSGEVVFVGSINISNLGGKGFSFNPATGVSEELGIELTGGQAYTTSSGGVVFEATPKKFREFDPIDRQLVNMTYQKIWRLTSTQIDQFRQDFQSNTVNFAQYPDIASWPGNGITSKGEDAQLAPYEDVNNDGLYRPGIDGDYPCIMGDQALWWVYHDDGPHVESGGTPIGIQVEGMAYAFDCNLTPCPDSNIAYSTFYHYELTHKAPTTLQDVYLGFWNDVDLGNWTDDYIGCDSTRNLGFVYNGDIDDEGPLGYGTNPPAFGVRFIGNSTMDKFTTYDNDSIETGYPREAIHFYNYLRGRWLDSTAFINNGNSGHYLTGPGTPTDYLYSGDPGACTGIPSGWTEGSANTTPFDRRIIQSTGPFNLTQNATIVLDMAYIYARGYYNDQLGSLCELLNSSDSISSWWDGLDKSCFNLVMSNQPKPRTSYFECYPNPTASNLYLKLPEGFSSYSVQLFEPSGKMVREFVLESGQPTSNIQVAELPDGVYVVQCLADGQRFTRKVVIQH